MEHAYQLRMTKHALTSSVSVSPMQNVVCGILSDMVEWFDAILDMAV